MPFRTIENWIWTGEKDGKKKKKDGKKEEKRWWTLKINSNGNNKNYIRNCQLDRDGYKMIGLMEGGENVHTSNMMVNI